MHFSQAGQIVFGGQLFEMLPVFKRNSIWKNEFLLWSVVICLVRIITVLNSDQQTYTLKANYCARQNPRIMRNHPCFHRTRNVAETRVCAMPVWIWGKGHNRVVVQDSGSVIR